MSGFLNRCGYRGVDTGSASWGYGLKYESGPAPLIRIPPKVEIVRSPPTLSASSRAPFMAGFKAEEVPAVSPTIVVRLSTAGAPGISISKK